MATQEVAQSVPAPFQRGNVVYFAGAEEGPVKIGYTSEMPRRLRSLIYSSPVPIGLLAAVRGDRSIEKAYHARFKADRLHGEWFARSEAIEEEIARLIWQPQVMFKFIGGVAYDARPELWEQGSR